MTCVEQINQIMGHLEELNAEDLQIVERWILHIKNKTSTTDPDKQNCETCVFADFDGYDLNCCSDGLGKHKSFLFSGDNWDEILKKIKSNDDDLFPCKQYRNESDFDLSAVPRKL
ncbi:unnamed protein product [marine sediment metagenome]|uniref:Uncharacterized protein n=1 Tax=marine sediment metagenome TaxID=412755 RepID=X1CGN7_9ZZZZ